MPMGGLGSRFTTAGFTIPKPLIPVDGMPMFKKALSSINSISSHVAYYFVIRQEHVDKFDLGRRISETLPAAHIIVIPTLTKGAAETAYAATEQLDPNSPLIIMDCDIWFKSQSYEEMINDATNNEKSNVDGGLLTFNSDNPSYSYAIIDTYNTVLETAEKKVISNNAITGAYFFSRAETFIDAAEELLAMPISESMPEYYLSNLYNILLSRGRVIKASYVDNFASFGTPDELQSYNQRQR